jgi:hypothetical protein
MPHAKLSEESVTEIRRLHAGGARITDLAGSFGVRYWTRLRDRETQKVAARPMTCPEPIDERPEARAMRGCLVGLALCVLGVLLVLLLAWKGWWLDALSLAAILLIVVAVRSERGREDLGEVTEGTRRRL